LINLRQAGSRVEIPRVRLRPRRLLSLSRKLLQPFRQLFLPTLLLLLMPNDGERQVFSRFSDTSGGDDEGITIARDNMVIIPGGEAIEEDTGKDNTDEDTSDEADFRIGALTLKINLAKDRRKLEETASTVYGSTS
jgi:hypothetical protein